jgi:hypothetical protein
VTLVVQQQSAPAQVRVGGGGGGTALLSSTLDLNVVALNHRGCPAQGASSICGDGCCVYVSSAVGGQRVSALHAAGISSRPCCYSALQQKPHTCRMQQRRKVNNLGIDCTEAMCDRAVCLLDLKLHPPRTNPDTPRF